MCKCGEGIFSPSGLRCGLLPKSSLARITACFARAAHRSGVNRRLYGAFPAPEEDLLQPGSNRSSNSPSNQRIGPQNDKLARIRRGNRLSFREASVLRNIAPVGLDCRLCNRLEKGAPSAGSALLSCSLNRPTPAAGRTLLPLPGRSGAAGWAGFARKPTAASPCRTRPRWPWLSVRPASG